MTNMISLWHIRAGACFLAEHAQVAPELSLWNATKFPKPQDPKLNLDTT
jgi:hypothetical protein